MENVLKVGQVVSLKEFSIRNKLGGTTVIEKKDIKQKQILAHITKTWYDYEVGERAEGELIDKNVIDEVAKLGESEYTPEHYKQYGEESYKSALKAWNSYKPNRVFFTEFDIEETLTDGDFMDFFLKPNKIRRNVWKK